MLETADGEIGKSMPWKQLDGGGGGSRTRVRKHVVEELYMRVRF